MSEPNPTLGQSERWTFPLITGWLVSRIIMVLIWFTQAQFIINDVYYYFRQLSAGAHDSLVEYPSGSAWFLTGLHALFGSNSGSFATAFVVLMGLLDVAVTVILWRHSVIAAAYWTLFLAVLGPLIWFRIDLLPSAALTCALVLARKAPIASGALIAVGAALKLWPALLIFPLLGFSTAAKKRGLGFVGTGLLLGVTSLATYGWDRSISPLTWQSDRGLQIESVLASVPMFQHAFGAGTSLSGASGTSIYYSDFNAYQIDGPNVGMWLHIGDIAMVALIVGTLIGSGAIAIAERRAMVHPYEPEHYHLVRVLAVTTIIGGLLICNKTLSPQYLIWLAGPCALSVALLWPKYPRTAILLGTIGVVAALLTQVVYPLNYGQLVTNPTSDAATTVALLARNLALCVLTGFGVILSVRALLRPRRDSPMI